MKSIISLLAMAVIGLAGFPSASQAEPGLGARCAWAQAAHRRLRLIVEAEETSECGAGENCRAGETSGTAAPQAQPPELGRHRLLAYDKASGACAAWRADPESPALHAAAAHAAAAALALGETAIGTVIRFSAAKGYGFIVRDDGERDVFVHISAVERSGLAGLDKGDRVEFELEVDRRGKASATRLRPIR
jgi:cold shock CspA family protein